MSVFICAEISSASFFISSSEQTPCSTFFLTSSVILIRTAFCGLAPTLIQPSVSSTDTAQVSTGHARALLAVENPEEQYNLAQRIFDEKLSVRDVEKLVKNLHKPAKPKKTDDKTMQVIYQDIEEKLKQKLGIHIHIIFHIISPLFFVHTYNLLIRPHISA